MRVRSAVIACYSTGTFPASQHTVQPGDFRATTRLSLPTVLSFESNGATSTPSPRTRFRNPFHARTPGRDEKTL
ncbi:hypothetical protein BT67DRAFT_442310 [Trichocladium antarcticum]|uniref:Uncharacterized protein n=1 Tax=Trichocladium antarcticum TaxID=1450529 RepID=A0AAN6ZE09_9PEZI|nr:hypothetical protein BT67DRAFT_442310 [Trichocladium antarcticum]